MARSNNCVNMHVQYIQWRSDSLIYYFGTSQVNQMGDIANDPWHVYSNPKNPKICPVIDLDKYFFYHTNILTINTKLFPGNDQYGTILDIFHKIINNNLEEFQYLGVDKGKLGSHYVSKGVIKIVSNGCTVSTPMDSIYLRACWIMGTIKDRYIQYEKAGDQFVGRSVTGIFVLAT